MREVFVNVGFRKLKGVIVGEENGKYIIELEDKSRVIVEEEQIEGDDN
ncbi:hypothetical protein J1P26_22045 [Neobacillus sp. MM2021_6]|nr:MULTISPECIES: hypothetical protein [Bacillaceae]MBO0962387.1 hypothetical protein [Neobacillus sp. MM2021_6]NHC21044.1 hypothetical protein [Bacillus sp. MM2020_4]